MFDPITMLARGSQVRGPIRSAATNRDHMIRFRRWFLAKVTTITIERPSIFQLRLSRSALSSASESAAGGHEDSKSYSPLNRLFVLFVALCVFLEALRIFEFIKSLNSEYRAAPLLVSLPSSFVDLVQIFLPPSGCDLHVLFRVSQAVSFAGGRTFLRIAHSPLPVSDAVAISTFVASTAHRISGVARRSGKLVISHCENLLNRFAFWLGSFGVQPSFEPLLF
jgi:hypothetical protein